MKKITRIPAMLCVVALLAFSGGAAATILSGSSGVGANFAKLFPVDSPPSAFQVGADNWNVDGVFWGFDEKSVTLGAQLNVFSGNGSLPTILAAGTPLSSHYIFFDPLVGQITGTVKFNAPILGVLWSTADVTGSNGLFGLQGVTYNFHEATGLEATDLFSLRGRHAHRELGSVGSGGSYPRLDRRCARARKLHHDARRVDSSGRYRVSTCGLILIDRISRACSTEVFGPVGPRKGESGYPLPHKHRTDGSKLLQFPERADLFAPLIGWITQH